MALYVSFPVALFHYFNQPENFEEWVSQLKHEINPPQDAEFKEQVKRVAKEIRERTEERMLKGINENTK